MLVSLNWIRDFVDLPENIDAQALAEKFTTTTAEVEGVQRKTCDATGLIAAEVLSVAALPESSTLFAVTVNTGQGKLDTVTLAEDLCVGDRVIFAPPGATVSGIGTITEKQTAGRTSQGMILPGNGLGLETIGQRAVWLPPSTKPGTPIDTGVFNDWVIEIDNKSITHRPDLWGHYGIAREIAAMCRQPLKPYEVAPLDALTDPRLPEIPIVIDAPKTCPRYSGLRFTGVKPQPAPLKMQARLALVGLRPIDILVDLTNYIMLELGQPMHAFDGANVDRIEVATAQLGEKFATLDGVERTMPQDALMIQCHRKSVALAGIMGGADTEITEKTTDLLLESANFEPATIRRCATALGHRTDASTRFEKSQDPANTVLAIQRFVHLAKPELPEMKFISRLSDCFPHPPVPTVIDVDPTFLARYVGRQVPTAEIKRILTALEFEITESPDRLRVVVPSFRATKDIAIEADIIEEVARYIGYNSIDPCLPTITVRYSEPPRTTRLERETLNLLCGGMSYAEVHRYIWFDDNWLKTLGYDAEPTIALKNPAAAGMAQLRTTLLPGLIAAVDLNRHHFDHFELMEVGSIFARDTAQQPEQAERRHLGLVRVAPGRKATHEDALFSNLKTDIETWARQSLDADLTFVAAQSTAPWEHEVKTAFICIDRQPMGRITVLPATCKRRIDEHLAAWSVALAEIDLSAVAGRPPQTKKLVPMATYPQIELDFSTLVTSDRRYADITDVLATYDHPLLRRLVFVSSYEGGSVPTGKRSLSFRAIIGHQNRTLTEQDIQDFRANFIAFLENNKLELRS